MNLKELREKLAALFAEGKPLAERSKAGTLTEAEAKRLEEIAAEAETLNGQIADAEKRERAAEGILAGDKQYNVGTGTRAAHRGGRETAHEAQRRDAEEALSIGQRFARSEALKEYRQDGGKQSRPVAVGSFYHRSAPDLQITEGMTAAEVRALVYTGAFPATMIPTNRVPGIFTPEMPDLTVRSAFINGQTNSPAIEFFRELAFTNSAAAVAEASATTGSTGLKPESGLTFEQASTTVKTLAHWIPITRQALDDEPQIQSIIEGRLIDGLKLVEDDQLLNGSGSGANLRGLLNTTGVQALDAAYFTANAVDSAGTANENYNRILRARRMIRITGRARPNFVLLNPADVEKFLTSTDANRAYMAGGPFTAGTLPSLWGLRLIETEAVAAKTAVVGDGRMAAVFDRMQAQILIDTVNDQFIRNMLTILAEERLAFAVFRPAAFAVVTLA